jgi:DNA helicase-4
VPYAEQLPAGIYTGVCSRMRTRSLLLARMLSSRAIRSISVTPDEVIVEGPRGMVHVPHEEVRSVSSTDGLVWRTLRLAPADASSSPLVLRWVWRWGAAGIARDWLILGLGPRVTAAAESFRVLLERDAYFNHEAWLTWRRSPGLVDPLPPETTTEGFPGALAQDFAYCREMLAQGATEIEAFNRSYVERKKEQHKGWFAQAAEKGLNSEQQEAILRDEDNTLVVAGAGTGKTSTVAGKVGYLLQTGAARPEQILLLSFTRKAAVEMSDRVTTTVGEVSGVVVRTFHSLGLEIISQTRGKRPSLARFVEDEAVLVDLLTKLCSRPPRRPRDS